MWQRNIVEKPLEKSLSSIFTSGFSRIYNDRRGYEDDAAELAPRLSALLNEQPVISTDNDLIFLI